jgi:hypothetical protein
MVLSTKIENRSLQTFRKFEDVNWNLHGILESLSCMSDVYGFSRYCWVQLLDMEPFSLLVTHHKLVMKISRFLHDQDKPILHETRVWVRAQETWSEKFLDGP